MILHTVLATPTCDMIECEKVYVVSVGMTEMGMTK